MKNIKSAAIMIAMSSYMPTERARKKEIAKTAKTPTVPSGAKRFYFSIIGEPHHEQNELTVFSCVARDEENARRKFYNHRFNP